MLRKLKIKNWLNFFILHSFIKWKGNRKLAIFFSVKYVKFEQNKGKKEKCSRFSILFFVSLKQLKFFPFSFAFQLFYYRSETMRHTHFFVPFIAFFAYLYISFLYLLINVCQYMHTYIHKCLHRERYKNHSETFFVYVKVKEHKKKITLHIECVCVCVQREKKKIRKNVDDMQSKTYATDHHHHHLAFFMHTGVKWNEYTNKWEKARGRCLMLIYVYT